MLRLLKSPNSLKYLVAAIILMVPLYPKFPFIKVPGTFVSIRLEDFLLVAAVLVFAVHIFPNIRDFLSNKINRAIFLFLLVGIVSLLSSILLTKTVAAHIGFLHWLRRVEYFVPFFLAGLAIKRNRKNLEFFLKVGMITIIVVFFYGLGQRYLSWPIIITQNLEYSKGIALRWIPGSHINSTFAGHYDLGTFLVLLLPIYITLFFLVKGVRARLLLFVVVSAGLWLLAYSGSRISTFSYLVGATGALVLIKKYKAIPAMIVISLLFFSMSGNLVARYSRIIEVTGEKIKQILYTPNQGIVFAQRRETATPTPAPKPVFEDRSISIRLNVEWPRALRAFSKNPLLGTGYSSLTLATDGDYLRLLGEVGILGFLAFFLIFARIGKSIRAAFPLAKNYQGVELAFLVGVIGALPGVFLNAVFIDIFEASKFAIIFWLFIGLAVGLASLKSNE